MLINIGNYDYVNWDHVVEVSLPDNRSHIELTLSTGEKKTLLISGGRKEAIDWLDRLYDKINYTDC